MCINMLAKIKRFLKEEDGPTAIEYMLMVSIVVIFSLVAINAVGRITQDSYNHSAQSISTAMQP